MGIRFTGMAGIFLVGIAAVAQSGTAAAPAMETASDLVRTLSSEEQQSFHTAGIEFNANKFPDALAKFKALLAAHPGDSFLSKMVGESALNTGDTQLALSTMQPVDREHPDDWQASSLMARIYAETGDKAKRDAEFAHMTDLYKRGLTPKGFTQYLVEKVPVGDKQIMIFNSLVPWGNFKVYNSARVFDADNKMVLRIQLESADFDQPLWAKQHPKEAAAGGRMFSLDGYSQGPANASGQAATSQALYGFLDARPTYDEARGYFISIATGKGIKSVNGTITK